MAENISCKFCSFLAGGLPLPRAGEGRKAVSVGAVREPPCGAGGVDVVFVALKPRPLAPEGERVGERGDCGALNPRFRQTNRRSPLPRPLSRERARGEGRAVREPPLR